jgi:hypothetical protein
MATISFTPIVPKGKVIDASVVLREIERTLRSVTGPKLQRDFKKTVRTWDNRPRFSKTFVKLPNRMVEKVFPTGVHKDQYYYVHEGTKARLIVPKIGNAVLKFQAGYISATRPGRIRSQHAFRHGNTVFATEVRRHPGITARKFSTVIARKQQKPFEIDIQEAINRAVD